MLNSYYCACVRGGGRAIIQHSQRCGPEKRRGEDIEKVRDGDGDGNSNSGRSEEEIVSNSAVMVSNSAATERIEQQESDGARE